jgi:hypothetical protein
VNPKNKKIALESHKEFIKALEQQTVRGELTIVYEKNDRQLTAAHLKLNHAESIRCLEIIGEEQIKNLKEG